MAADLDNLEYYIKFPNPNFIYNQQNGESDFVFVVNEEKIPVILLFGWAGCQDKYLAKYSQIYEDKGLITLRYTAPVKCLLMRKQSVAIGKRLVRLLVDLNFESHPIIVHCFSNSGAFLYQNFSLALVNTPKPLQIKGVIFDSGPGKRRLYGLYKAVSSILGGKPFYNIPASMVMTMILSMLWLFEVIKTYFKPIGAYQSNPFEMLQSEENRCPQHFIYSKTDDLIAYKDVEYFSNVRKSKGVAVTTLCYEEGEHVKHYTQHKESYINSVCNFLNRCLNGSN